MNSKRLKEQRNAAPLCKKTELKSTRVSANQGPEHSTSETLEELRCVRLLLDEAREQYADLYELSPVSYITLSSEGLITEINPAGTVLLGEERDKILDRPFASYVTPDHLDDWHLHFSHALKTGENHSFEFTLSRGDRSIIYVRLDSQCRERGGNSTLRIALTDINWRKRLEQHFQLGEFVLDYAHEAAYLIDANHRFVYVNNEACRSLGYSREEMLGMTVMDIDADYSPAEIQVVRDRSVNECSLRHETRHRRRDGSTFPVEIQSSPIEYQQQMMDVALSRDISERKSAEEALRASEERMRLFFERQLVGMAITSPEKGWLQVNQKVCDMLGYTADELFKLSWADVTHPDDLPLDVTQFERMLAGEIDSYTVEKRYLRKDGGIVYAVLSIGCVRKADGAVDYVLALIEDISQRRRYEDELVSATVVLEAQNMRLHEYRETLQQQVEERTAELSASNQLLRVEIEERKQAQSNLESTDIQLRGLLARREEVREDERKRIAFEVHDELGQILTGLQMNVSHLTRQCATDSPLLRDLVQETVMLSDKAVQVARNVAAALRPVELDAGIVAALEMQVRRFRVVTGIQCKCTFAEDEVLLNDNCVTALYRIVQESLTNIAKHAQATEVHISLRKDAGDYVLKVRDNGIGFDVNAKKENSFGLLGIRERTRMLGGTVSIESRKGEGAETIVRIPKVSTVSDLDGVLK